jgi:hypothetical protein
MFIAAPQRKEVAAQEVDDTLDVLPEFLSIPLRSVWVTT